MLTMSSVYLRLLVEVSFHFFKNHSFIYAVIHSFNSCHICKEDGRSVRTDFPRTLLLRYYYVLLNFCEPSVSKQ